MRDAYTEGRGREISRQTGRLIAFSSLSPDDWKELAIEKLNRFCGWLSDQDIAFVADLHMNDLTVARWRDDAVVSSLAKGLLRQEETLRGHYGNSRSRREVSTEHLDWVARTAAKRAAASAREFLGTPDSCVCGTPAYCECYTDEKGWGYTS